MVPSWGHWPKGIRSRLQAVEVRAQIKAAAPPRRDEPDEVARALDRDVFRLAREQDVWASLLRLLLLQPNPRWVRGLLKNDYLEACWVKLGSGCIPLFCAFYCRFYCFLWHFDPPLCSRHCRDYTEGEERSEALLSAHHRQQMPLRRADHPDGGLLGRGPRREAWLWPH